MTISDLCSIWVLTTWLQLVLCSNKYKQKKTAEYLKDPPPLQKKKEVGIWRLTGLPLTHISAAFWPCCSVYREQTTPRLQSSTSEKHSRASAGCQGHPDRLQGWIPCLDDRRVTVRPWLLPRTRQEQRKEPDCNRSPDWNLRAHKQLYIHVDKDKGRSGETVN